MKGRRNPSPIIKQYHWPSFRAERAESGAIRLYRLSDGPVDPLGPIEEVLTTGFAKHVATFAVSSKLYSEEVLEALMASFIARVEENGSPRRAIVFELSPAWVDHVNLLVDMALPGSLLASYVHDTIALDLRLDLREYGALMTHLISTTPATVESNAGLGCSTILSKRGQPLTKLLKAHQSVQFFRLMEFMSRGDEALTWLEFRKTPVEEFTFPRELYSEVLDGDVIEFYRYFDQNRYMGALTPSQMLDFFKHYLVGGGHYVIPMLLKRQEAGLKPKLGKEYGQDIHWIKESIAEKILTAEEFRKLTKEFEAHGNSLMGSMLVGTAGSNLLVLAIYLEAGFARTEEILRELQRTWGEGYALMVKLTARRRTTRALLEILQEPYASMPATFALTLLELDKA